MPLLVRLCTAVWLAFALALNGVAMAAGSVGLPASSAGPAESSGAVVDGPPAHAGHGGAEATLVDLEASDDAVTDIPVHCPATADPASPHADGHGGCAAGGHGSCAACCVAATPPAPLAAPSFVPALFAVLPRPPVDARVVFLTGGPERPPRPTLA